MTVCVEASAEIESITLDVTQATVQVGDGINLYITFAPLYEVYRSTSKTGTYTRVKTTTNCYWANNGAASGTTCYYKVRAISSNSGAHSAYSSIDSIKSK